MGARMNHPFRPLFVEVPVEPCRLRSPQVLDVSSLAWMFKFLYPAPEARK